MGLLKHGLPKFFSLSNGIKTSDFSPPSLLQFSGKFLPSNSGSFHLEDMMASNGQLLRMSIHGLENTKGIMLYFWPTSIRRNWKVRVLEPTK